jgi:hypothetical protein
MVTKVIGIRGKKGTGKNFCAEVAARVIRSCGMTTKIGAFADPLKNFCIDVLGLDRCQCYGSDAEKNTPTRYMWAGMPDFVQNRYPEKTGYMTGREIMQVFGTELIRESFSDTVWLDAARRAANESGVDFFILTDLRFENEAQAIQDWGGEVWQISGPQRGEKSAGLTWRRTFP